MTEMIEMIESGESSGTLDLRRKHDRTLDGHHTRSTEACILFGVYFAQPPAM